MRMPHSDQLPMPLQREWSRWALPLLVVLVTWISFAPTLGADWIANWDDDWNFLLNERYRGLSWQHIEWAFTSFHHGHYQPLSWISAGVDYQLWGMDARGYHLTNLLLHSASAVMVYLLVLAMLRLVGGGDRTAAGLRWPAAVAALAFAIHPLRVESVAWITERRDVLAGLPALATLWFYLRWARPDPLLQRRQRYYWLAVLCFAISLFAKATALTLPVALLVLDVYPLRRIRWQGLRPQLARRVWLDKLPFLALSGLVGMFAIQAQASSTALTSLAVHPLAHRCMQACFGLCFYPLKTLVPLDLSPIYEIGNMDPLAPRFVASALAVLGISVLALWQRRAWPGLLGAWVFFAVIVAPVLGFAQSGPQLVADRYSYLSCLPAVVVAGCLVLRATTTWWRVVLPSLVLVLLGTMTFVQAGYWRDATTLFARAVAIEPGNSVAQFQLGMAYWERRQPDRAELYLSRAVVGRPQEAEAWNILGVIYDMRRQENRAIECWRRALAIDPEMHGAKLNLRRALERKR